MLYTFLKDNLRGGQIGGGGGVNEWTKFTFF